MRAAQEDAIGLAERVAAGEISPVELVEAACRRIEQIDPEIGAVPVRFFDEAIERARGVPRESPFAGIPFLMKDVGARQRGQPYYAANRALRDIDHRAESDTVLGARFRAIGLVTVGNSSTPEFGLQSNTWPLVYGPTRNPGDPERAAGGSSGGACAAVAAGLVPVAHASDGAGSIRIPAAWCGLVGLKPSRDRILWRHHGMGRSDVEFIVARSLRDTAAFLDQLSAPSSAAESPEEFSAALQRKPPALRVGVWVRSPAGSPVDADCRDAAQRAGVRLSEQGHAVEEAAPATFSEYAERAVHGAVLGAAQYRECLVELEERLGRPVGPGDVEPFLWELSLIDEGEAISRERDASARWHRGWVARTLRWFEDFDLLLTPTVCEPAPRLRELDPTRLTPQELLERMVPHMAFTEPWNATGQPAVSLPLAWSAEGLPLGVQLVARPGREDLLLGVAASLMEVGPDPKTPTPRIRA
jgi:amidase